MATVPTSSRRWIERLGQRDVVAQRLHRRDPGGAAGRQPRGRHGDDHADDVAGQHGAGPEDQRLPGQVESEVGEQRTDAHREQHAEAEAERRPDDTDHERLEQHRSGDLPLRRAQRPQERQLAAALGDQDRERVDDQERADHQRDAGEDEQEGTQEADRLEQVGGRLVGGRVAGDGLDVVRQPVGHGVAQLRLADAVVSRHPDVGEGVLALEEEVLRRRRVEGGEGRAVERATLGEVEDADQLRRQQRLVGGGDDVHLLADEVARPLGGLGVEDDLVGAVRRPARGQRETRQTVTGRSVGVVPADGRRTLAADDLVVLVDDVDAERRDVAVDPGRSRHALQVVDHRGGDRHGRRGAVGVAVGRTDDDVADGRGEQRREAAAQRVGEDQRAAHERDAEHDRERAHQQAQLAPEQALQGGLEHGRLRRLRSRRSSAP